MTPYTIGNCDCIWHGEHIVGTGNNPTDTQMIVQALNLMQHIRNGGKACPDVAAELHRDIMNLPETFSRGDVDRYKYGHRDARHAAAELVLERLGTNANHAETHSASVGSYERL